MTDLEKRFWPDEVYIAPGSNASTGGYPPSLTFADHPDARRYVPSPTSDSAKLEAAEKDFPDGAIHNGRVHMDRLEHDYAFTCEAGALRNCGDWHEVRRCFEAMADYLAAYRSADAPSPDAGDGWNRDMNTAPRDGTKFCATDGRLCFTTFRGKSYSRYPDREGKGAEFRWHWSYEDRDSVSEWKPVAWMPLPAPPRAAKREAE